MRKKILIFPLLLFFLISSSQVSSSTQTQNVKMPQLPLIDGRDVNLDYKNFDVDWAYITIWIEQENPSASFIYTSEDDLERISLNEAKWEIDKNYKVDIFASFDIEPALYERFPWGDYKYDRISIDNFTVIADLNTPDTLTHQEITFSTPIERLFTRHNAEEFTLNTTFTIGFSSTMLRMDENGGWVNNLTSSLSFHLLGSKLMYSPLCLDYCVMDKIYFDLQPWSLSSNLDVYSSEITPNTVTTSQNSLTSTPQNSARVTFSAMIGLSFLFVIVRRKRKNK